MAVKKLLNKGTVYKRNDNRWGGAVRYRDEQGVTRRKGFCAPTKKALLRKINDYIINFQKEIWHLSTVSEKQRKGINPSSVFAAGLNRGRCAKETEIYTK